MQLLTSHAPTWLEKPLTSAQISAFQHYFDALLAANQQVNLTAITDPEEVQVKHFLDSLTLLPYLPTEPFSLIDIGTGAGFPGVPLKIIRPDIQLTLVDSVGKKCAFLSQLAADLNLTDVQVIHARAEDIGGQPEHRAHYQIAAARAVARLPALLEYLLPLVAVGGQVLAQKGSTAPIEAKDSQNALRQLGGKLLGVHPVQLPNLNDSRHIVQVQKTRPTPHSYPRRAGLPTRQPL